MANDLTIANWAREVEVSLQPKARATDIAAYATVALAGAQVINRAVLGYSPKVKTIVDGRVGAALTTVKPDGGNIVFDFEIVENVLRWIMRALREASPVVSGAYRDSHILLADEREANVDRPIPAARQYVFISTVDYARRLEVGRRADGTPFVIQVKPRIYARVAERAKAEFAGRGVMIRDVFREYGGGETRPAIIVEQR
jgi:hypothetical protein